MDYNRIYKYNLLLIFIFNSLYCYNLYSFKDINEIDNYLKNYPEFPNYNGNIKNGDFTTFYKTLLKSNKFNLLNKFKFFNDHNLKYNDFVKKLDKINQKQKALYNNQNYNSFFIEIDQNSKIFLWGDIQAGFHTFARSIIYLFKENIIDKNFKIIKPDNYFIFNGNLIGQGPYPIETLNLVLNLIEKNENKVFYIKGQEEDLNVWPKHSLEKQISILQNNLNRNKINDLFQALPRSLFIKLKNHNNSEILAISYFNPGKYKFYNTNSKILNINNNQLYLFKNLILKKNIKIFIKGNELSNQINLINKKAYAPNFYYSQGLYRLDNILNKIAWTTKSCPIQLYRMHHNLFYDSFTLIDFKSNNLKSSQITIYFNDNQNSDFKIGSCYNLKTGETIKVGKSPLTHNIEPKDISKNFDIKNFNKDKINNNLKFLEERTELLQKKTVNLTNDLENKLANINIENINIENSNFNNLNNLNIDNNIDIYNILLDAKQNLNIIIDKLEQLEKLAITNKLIEDKFIESKENIKQNIIIGSSVPLTKFAKEIGKPIRQGSSLAITETNKHNTLDNNFIKLVVLNDKYMPDIFEKNIKSILYNYKTDLLLLVEGTENILQSLQFIKDNNMFIFFAKSGASFLRDPKLKNVVNYRASFQDEGKALVNYTIKEHSGKNFLFIYQDDKFGNELLKGAKSELEKNNIKNFKAIPYTPNTSIIKDIANQIIESNYDNIGFFLLGSSAISIIRELGLNFFINKFLFASSAFEDAVTIKIFKRFGLTILTSQVVPPIDLFNFKDAIDIEIVKEYKEKINKYGHVPNNFSLEAFIGTSILIDQISQILKTEKNKNKLTDNLGKKLVENMQKIKNYNFKGLKLNFNHNTRTLGTNIWLKTREGRYIIKDI